MTTAQSQPRIDTAAIPAHEIDTLARVILSAASRAFEDPKVAAEYERWKNKRKSERRIT